MKKPFVDQLKRDIQLEHPPKRIVSLVPSITEMLFYLGLDEEVVGITKFCIHPEEKFKEKPKVGGTKMLHLDRIREMRPQLIIANKEENRKEDIEKLEREFPVWVSYIVSLEDAYEMILALGELVDKVEKAMTLVREVEERFDKVQQMDEPLKVAYFIWRKPYMVAGGNTFINSILKRCGLINVFEDWGRYPKINVSDLKKTNPDVLLLSSEPFPFKEKHVTELEQQYSKALTHRVDGGMFSWYGSRLLKTPAYLNHLIDTLSLIKSVS